MRRPLRGIAAVICAAAASLGGTVHSVAREPSAGAQTTTNERVVSAAAEYWNAHPDNYAGLSAAIERAGGDTVRFSFPKAGLSDLTGAEAQRWIDRAKTPTARSTSDAEIQAIPLDAFSVSSAWYHVQSQDGEWLNFSGYWNFRDNFQVGSAPDDGAATATAGMPANCWRHSGDWYSSATYNGQNTSGAGYRRAVDYDSTVWGVRDRNSGFVMNTDHGSLTLSYMRRAYGCPLSQARGKFFFEHNQDGSGGWSFSISVAAFSLSYSGSPGQRLQKAPPLDYLY